MGFSLSKAFKSVTGAFKDTFDVLWEGSIAPLKFVADAVSSVGSLLGGPEMPDMPNPAQPPTSSRPQVAKRKAVPGAGATGGFSAAGPETLLTGGRGQTPEDSLLGSTSLLGR